MEEQRILRHKPMAHVVGTTHPGAPEDCEICVCGQKEDSPQERFEDIMSGVLAYGDACRKSGATLSMFSPIWKRNEIKGQESAAYVKVFDAIKRENGRRHD